MQIAERDRFLIHFDRLFHFVHDAVKNLPPEMRTWKPEGNYDPAYGERVAEVTCENIYIHMMVGEHHWLRNMASCADGDHIPTPIDRELTAKLEKLDYLAESLKMHEENLAIIRGYSEEELAKTVWFSKRKWTVMGFLWAIYGHRNYHLGNIDIFWRMAGADAPDYFQFHPVEMA